MHVDCEGPGDADDFQACLLTDVMSKRCEAQWITAVGCDLNARTIGRANAFDWTAGQKPLAAALNADHRPLGAFEAENVAVDGAANWIGRGPGFSGQRHGSDPCG